ncbi:hypothetical protein EU524_01690 [Candidatus Thorarchaeota archaeon]|nr:MAG: hypothetical protein EU524_01690 [Candidatus Thorarchaeota archaeon]
MKKEMLLVLSAFLILVISVPIIALGLDSSGSVGTAETFATFSAPLAALLAGTLGLARFAQEDYGLEDRFNSMNLLLSLGLVLFTLSEIGTAIISSMPSGDQFYFTISLLLIPGILLWAVGIGRYLIVCWKTINSVNPTRVLIAIFLFSAAATVGTQILGAVISPNRSLIDIAVCIPVGFGIIAIAGILAILLWTFRRGALGLPLGLAFVASLLFSVQYYSWCIITQAPTDILSRLIATEIYILMGASVSIAGRLDASTG